MKISIERYNIEMHFHLKIENDRKKMMPSRVYSFPTKFNYFMSSRSRV